MRLTHPLFSDPICFEENKINILVLESGALFTKIVQELSSQLNSMEGDFVFSQDFNPMSMGKNVELITDVFSMDINSRKIMGKIMDELCALSVNEDNYMKTLEFKQMLTAYIEPLLMDCDYSLTHDADIDLNQLFKSLKIETKTESGSMVDFLVEYFAIATKLLKIKCFVVVNLKSFLAQEELHLLYQEIMYKKYSVLLLESHAKEYILPCEKIRVMDKDLCEIKINH